MAMIDDLIKLQRDDLKRYNVSFVRIKGEKQTNMLHSQQPAGMAPCATALP